MDLFIFKMALVILGYVVISYKNVEGYGLIYLTL